MGRGRLARHGCSAPVPTSLDRLRAPHPPRLADAFFLSSACRRYGSQSFPSGELLFSTVLPLPIQTQAPSVNLLGLGLSKVERIPSIFGSCPHLGLGPVVLRHPGISDSLAHLASPSCPFRAILCAHPGTRRPQEATSRSQFPLFCLGEARFLSLGASGV